MFENLSEKLQTIFKRLSGRGRLTERDIDDALREVRLALLEADVNFKVVKALLANVRERALGTEVLQSLSPGQQVIKIVHQELVATLGAGPSKLGHAPQPPTIIMLIGLQGSGKTTTAAKLALHLRRSGQRPLLVAADIRRPAAVDQLVALGRQLDIPVHTDGTSLKPIQIATNALHRAKELAASAVILDTAGGWHIDEMTISQLAELRAKLHPTEVLLVADAMTGQEAVRVAEEFQAKVGLTGLILTKVDGDARGGAALSITWVTGVPIKFIGTGEKPDALETYHPDRIASRILGMGDMLSLIEKAEAAFDAQTAKELEKKLHRATFDLADFLEQLHQIKKMGPLSQILEMIPGLSRRQLPQEVDEKQFKKMEAIIYSMTPEERHHPEIIDGSRRRRIARGSGTNPQEVNQLLNQFHQTQKMLKFMAKRPGVLPKLW